MVYRWFFAGICVLALLRVPLLFFSKETEGQGETHYGALILDPLEGRTQKNALFCGPAALSYLLTEAGYSYSQEAVAEQMGLDEPQMISFTQMEKFIAQTGLRSQSLHVDFSYFRNKPTPSILHVFDNHFMVFIEETEERGAILLFDPAYGVVLGDYSLLKKIWNGRLFYVYR